ncbi:MAG: hypothetical protein ABI378_02695 [Chitinophagaceae bacterium]
MECLLTKISRNAALQKAFPFLIIAFVIIFFWLPLHLDLWNDEVYSLIHFQKVPFLITVTDYHESNNHVFFNLLLNGYLKIIGSPSNSDIFHHPEIVRIVPLAFVIGSYMVLYKWIHSMLGFWQAVFGITLLSTTLAYYNFALQYRAYSLLILLGILYSHSLWHYFKNGRKIRLGILALCTMLLFYAHPAAIYLIVALSIALLFSFFSSDLRSKAIRAAFATCIGAALAGLAYLPIIPQMLQNPWIAGHKISAITFLRDKFISCTFQFIDGRYWLLALTIAGFITALFLVRKRNKKISEKLRWMLFCAIVYLIVFAVPLARHDNAPQRTFTMLVPFVVVGITIALDTLFANFFFSKWPQSLLLVFSIMMAIQFPYRLAARNQEIELLQKTTPENASMNSAYYLHHFEPMRFVESVSRRVQQQRLQVFCESVNRQEIAEYLKVQNLPFLQYENPYQRSFARDSFFIITIYPAKTLATLGDSIRGTLIPVEGSFYSLLFAKRNHNLH